MSAQNVIPNKLVEAGIARPRNARPNHDSSNLIALGFIILLLTIVIMSSVLIYMSLSGVTGESMLLVGIFPFTIVFIMLLLSK